MASTTDPVKIVIDENGDLTLNLYQILRPNDESEKFIGTHGKMTRGTIVATMRVSRQILMDNSQSMKVEFTGGRWIETYATTVDMEVDTVVSVETVLRVLHDKMIDITDIPIKEVWETIQYCEYRQIDVLKLERWFAAYLDKIEYKKLKHTQMVQLLYPCYVFNHVKGFATMTRKLAYEMSDHITEINPTAYRHLHLDGNVIGSLNGARGSLRSKMLRGLFDPVSKFLTSTCSCKEKSLFAYNMGLSKTGIWPLHEHHKKSVQEVLDSEGFQNWNVAIPEGACLSCKSALSSSTVKALHVKIAADFHGICIDCMKMTKGKDVDEDYWEHDREKEWDLGCSIHHGQPTWYFSFMGRKTDMTKHYAKKRANFEARFF